METDGSLVLKPARGRFLKRIGVLVVGGAVQVGLVSAASQVRGEGPFDFTMLFWAGIFGAVAASPALYTGSTRVDAGGVSRRVGWSRRRFSWEEIERVSLVPAPLSRASYWLVLHPRKGRALALPAPLVTARGTEEEAAGRLEPVYERAGEHRERVSARPVSGNPRKSVRFLVVLSVVLVVLELPGTLMVRPWEQSWWPGKQEAFGLPGACSVVERDDAVRLVPGAEGREQAGASDEDRSCVWEADGHVLAVRLMREKPGLVGGDGSVERARKRHAALAEERRTVCLQWSVKVGDEFCEVLETSGGEVRMAGVLVRENNVIVDIAYRADGPVEDPDGEMAQMADEVIGEIRFS
ncbi:hypothetical protein GCM10009550_18490 [Actinocorallia libanotica]|uniref:PH (Pleckstrin Homology) domain-containing protein n=2 Tax=Actinocorallia libanotica TaxID=46162 RepID=A0ABN1QN22_9ACTN